MNSGLKLGNRIAPPRFIAYALGLVAAGVFAVLQSGHELEYFLIGFDLVTLLFLLSLIPLFRTKDPQIISQHAQDNDANRVALLVISLGISGVILGALTMMVIGKSDYSKLLVVVTLALCWLFANLVYSLHYAHLYYTPMDRVPADNALGDTAAPYAGGLSIPSTKTPDYYDFIHFSVILGMTFQTADIDITSTKIRRASTWHCLEAFIFNIGIIAFTINMLGN